MRPMITLILLPMVGVLCAADANKPTEPTGPGFVISEMRVQTMAGFTYLYASSETTFEKMAEPVQKTVPLLTKAMADGQARQAGPVIFTYRDVKDMSQPFKLDIGCSVAGESQPIAGFEVRKVEPFKCATMLYSGPIQNISKVYEKLTAAINDAKLKPTSTAREFYLYWEGPDSPNNVVQVQMGIE